jgi:hypothetical protein
MAHVCATLTLLGISPDEVDADADAGSGSTHVSNP